MKHKDEIIKDMYKMLEDVTDYKWECGLKEMEHFAELVRQDEREACLAIVETHPTVRAMSIAIRARGEK